VYIKLQKPNAYYTKSLLKVKWTFAFGARQNALKMANATQQWPKIERAACRSKTKIRNL